MSESKMVEILEEIISSERRDKIRLLIVAIGIEGIGDKLLNELSQGESPCC